MSLIKLVVSLVFLFASFNSYAFQEMGEISIHGEAEVKDASSVDMWDKKNEAVKDAKEKATIALVRRLLSQEEFEPLEEKIRDEIVPKSKLFLLDSEVKKHNMTGEHSYTASVVFKYSLKNLKAILKNNGIYFREVREPKIASFIEVMDYSKVKTHRWWDSQNTKDINVHRALVPLRREMHLGMNDQGFKLLAPRKISNPNSLKDSAIAQGAHYYIKGKLKVEDDPRGFQVKDGEFYIYEAFSQKLVATLNLKELQKEMEKAREEEVRLAKNLNKGRSPASIESANARLEAKKPNVIRESFKDAAVKMASSADEGLNSGITLIKVAGITRPQQIESVKASLSDKLGSKVGNLIERRIEKGSVEFSVRTTAPTNMLVSMINRASYSAEEIALQEAEAMTSGKGLIVRIRR